jgi:DNA repair ATPase RecN
MSDNSNNSNYEVLESKLRATHDRMAKVEQNFDKLAEATEKNYYNTAVNSNELGNLKSWSKNHTQELKEQTNKLNDIQNILSKNEGSDGIINKVLTIFLIPCVVIFFGATITFLYTLL